MYRISHWAMAFLDFLKAVYKLRNKNANHDKILPQFPPSLQLPQKTMPILTQPPLAPPCNRLWRLTVDFERGAVVLGRPLQVDDEESGPFVRRPVHTPQTGVLP